MNYILEYLEIKDLLKFSAVCKKWSKSTVPQVLIEKWDVYRMLMMKPVGAGNKELAMWRRLKPMNPQQFIAAWKKIAPEDNIDWALNPLIEKNFKNADFGDTMVFG